MTQQEKIEIIKAEKELIIASLNAYLDTTYDMIEQFLNKDNSLKDGLNPEKKVVDFLKSTREDCKKFEAVRAKIIAEDFNLSLAEIARASLGLVFAKTRFEKEIEFLQEAKEKTDTILEKLLEGQEIQDIDFSQEK